MHALIVRGAVKNNKIIFIVIRKFKIYMIYSKSAIKTRYRSSLTLYPKNTCHDHDDNTVNCVLQAPIHESMTKINILMLDFL